MGKFTVLQENNDQELSVARGQAFLSSLKKNTEVIFPQAQWTVRVDETDSDNVI